MWTFSKTSVVAFIRTSSMTNVDVHQLSYGLVCHLEYGCLSDQLWTSVSFYRDVYQNINGRPSAFMQTSIRTFVDVYQFLYGQNHDSYKSLLAFIWTLTRTLMRMSNLSCRPSLHSWTSVSLYRDVHQISHGR